MIGSLSPVRRGRSAVALIVVLTLSLAGCRRGAPPVPPEVPRNVRVLELRKGDFVESLSFSGTMAPVHGTDVSAEEGGVVVRIVHDKGDTVRATDVLVRLDDRLLRAGLDAARADLSLREFDADRTGKLFAAGKVSEQQKLTADAACDRAAAAVRTAELRVEKCSPAAPYAGVVAARYVEPGQLVVPGQRVARVVNPYVLKLVGALTEDQVGWVRTGASATVTLEDGTRATGAVGFVGLEADPATGKFPVEVDVPNRDVGLRPGVIGRAVLTKAVHHGVLAIPRDAVVTTPAGPEVYVIRDDRAHRREVTLGPGRGMMVMVTDGLAPGDLLVVRGQRELTEGALVRITEQAARPDGSGVRSPEARP